MANAVLAWPRMLAGAARPPRYLVRRQRVLPGWHLDPVAAHNSAVYHEAQRVEHVGLVGGAAPVLAAAIPAPAAPQPVQAYALLDERAARCDQVGRGEHNLDEQGGLARLVVHEALRLQQLHAQAAPGVGALIARGKQVLMWEAERGGGGGSGSARARRAASQAWWARACQAPRTTACPHVQLGRERLAVIGAEPARGCLGIKVRLKPMHKRADAVAALCHSEHAQDRHLAQVSRVVRGVRRAQRVVHLKLLKHCSGEGRAS